MSANPSKTLEILFSMEESDVERDLWKIRENGCAFANAIQWLAQLPLNAKSAETDARLAHLFMVQAHELCRRYNVPAELKTFSAAFGASQVVQDAGRVAMERDKLAELSHLMDRVRQRAGLAENELWLDNHAHEDYTSLKEEYKRVLKSIVDTVFIEVLRRYYLDDIADLFEHDRTEFEIQREIGRRYMVKKAEEISLIDRITDDLFEMEYGEQALRRVRIRLKEIRGQLG